MLPRTAARETITVYNYLPIPTPEQPKRFTYKRTVLRDCVWLQDSHAQYRKTGIASADAVTLKIGFDADYVNASVFDGRGWALALDEEITGTYIVRGECPHMFPEEPDADADFVEGYVMPFEKKYPYKRVRELVERFVGNRGLWHVEARCK